MRPHSVNEIEEIGPRIPLDVELDAIAERRELRGNLEHVAGRDVTGISARMHGNAGRTVRDAYTHRVDDARDSTAARVAERRNLVDIDAETRTV
jgi:hypothetical protein